MGWAQEGIRNTYTILVGKSVGKKPLGRSRAVLLQTTNFDLFLIHFKTDIKFIIQIFSLRRVAYVR